MVVVTVSANTNNASLYGQQVTSVDARLTTSGDAESVTSWSDNVTKDVAAAVADDDVIMASLLCVGAVVCITSLSVLVFLAVRRRLRAAGDKRVVVPVSAARRLLAIASAVGAPTAAGELMIRRENSYYAPQPQPPMTRTLYGDKWTASHVTAMKLLITGHQRDVWAATADTCFV